MSSYCGVGYEVNEDAVAKDEDQDEVNEDGVNEDAAAKVEVAEDGGVGVADVDLNWAIVWFFCYLHKEFECHYAADTARLIPSF